MEGRGGEGRRVLEEEAPDFSTVTRRCDPLHCPQSGRVRAERRLWQPLSWPSSWYQENVVSCRRRLIQVEARAPEALSRGERGAEPAVSA